MDLQIFIPKYAISIYFLAFGPSPYEWVVKLSSQSDETSRSAGNVLLSIPFRVTKIAICIHSIQCTKFSWAAKIDRPQKWPTPVALSRYGNLIKTIYIYVKTLLRAKKIDGISSNAPQLTTNHGSLHQPVLGQKPTAP